MGDTLNVTWLSVDYNLYFSEREAKWNISNYLPLTCLVFKQSLSKITNHEQLTPDDLENRTILSIFAKA